MGKSAKKETVKVNKKKKNDSREKHKKEQRKESRKKDKKSSSKASSSTSSSRGTSTNRVKSVRSAKRSAPTQAKKKDSRNANSPVPAPENRPLAEPVVAISEDAVEKNQRQIDMIVGLLEAIRAEHVTKQNKIDLDKIQLMIKNIVYREAGESLRVRSIKFTTQQEAIIKKVVGNEDGTSAYGNSASLADPNEPRFAYPYEKLDFVPTRTSTTQKK